MGLSIHPAILVSFGLCFILLIWVICEQQLGRMIVRGVVGTISMVVINQFVPIYIALPLNIWTIILAICVGIPGVIMFYLIRIILYYI